MKGYSNIVILQYPINKGGVLPPLFIGSVGAAFAGKSSFDAVWRQNVGVHCTNKEFADCCILCSSPLPF